MAGSNELEKELYRDHDPNIYTSESDAEPVV